ncbi:MAG: endonuclease/exonuclease/phosphatase family protein [Candidatus Hydrogenedentes bacterium]|nr:endonuclease/exonuclease/phosphatase family protein [Candidatus Hydrogenedentota bacterium]
MMERREFLRTSAVLTTSSIGLQAGAFAQAAPGGNDPQRLTTISYNVLACRGYPETDENRDRLARAREHMTTRFALELGLYGPDIVTFQESPSEEVVASIAQQLGMNYAYFPGGWPGNADWPGGFPGTIMSRFPIVEKENCPLREGTRPEDLFTRHWCRAVLKTGTGRLSIYSAHLHPSDAAVREREVTEILKVLAPELESGAPLLFQGDLNHMPDGPEYARWTGAGLVDTFASKGTGIDVSIPSTEPRERIDYIWAYGPVAGQLVEARILFEGQFRTSPADTKSFALSDHVPALARFTVS